MESTIKKWGTSFIVLFFMVVAFLTGANTIWARAGGGDDFGGGGFDSGGFSSSSSSSFSSSSWDGGSGGGGSSSIGCCIMIIVVIIFVVIIMSNRRGGGGKGGVVGKGSTSRSPINTASSSTPELSSQSSGTITEKLKELKKIDLKFDKQKFKTHTKKVFMAVQKGWTERDQEVCRPFMAEEVYQSHQMQIDQMKKDKIINVLKKIVVGSVAFAKVESDTEYDKITMKMRAAMTDYKVKEDTPDKVVSGSKTQSPPFTEYWVFTRKAGLKTKVKDGIFDRKCPNCGAPIKIDVAGVCKYCEANVVNGDYDWVLSEIIQKSEWTE